MDIFGTGLPRERETVGLSAGSIQTNRAIVHQVVPPPLPLNKETFAVMEAQAVLVYCLCKFTTVHWPPMGMASIRSHHSGYAWSRERWGWHGPGIVISIHHHSISLHTLRVGLKWPHFSTKVVLLVEVSKWLRWWIQAQNSSLYISNHMIKSQWGLNHMYSPESSLVPRRFFARGGKNRLGCKVWPARLPRKLEGEAGLRWKDIPPCPSQNLRWYHHHQLCCR